MTRIQPIRVLPKIIAAAVFGAVFWLLTALGQPQLTTFTGGSGCCQRCSDFLYHSAQPVLVICAMGAFFCQSLVMVSDRRLRSFVKKAAICWLCFQGFSLWTAWHLLHRTPCTALYSPGPIFLIGAIVVVVVLLIESTVWSLICSAMIGIVEGLKLALRKEEPANLSLKTLL
jgi:hypothetical protein